MNTVELNKVLSEEIYKLRSNKAKPERVNAITRAASQIIAAARLEITFVKMVGIPNKGLPFFSHHGGKVKALPAPKARKAA